MTGPSIGPILSPCPFAPCAASPMLVIEQAAPGDDETTVKRIPQHQIAGDASRFGQCPASLMVVPLDKYSQDSLRVQANAVMLMMPAGDKADPRGDALPPRPAAPEHPLTPHPDRQHEIQRQAYQDMPKRPTAGVNVPQAGKAGRGVVPLPEGPHAGPGAGRASAPHPPNANDIVEQHPTPKLSAVPNADRSKRSMSNDDLRGQLISLTNLAIEGFGQQQELCSQMTETMASLAGLCEALEEKQDATHQLAVAAVGAQSNAPQAATYMVLSSGHMATATTAIHAAHRLVTDAITEAHGYAGIAAANGREYLAVI